MLDLIGIFSFQGRGDGLLIERSGLHDNWDDAEGYYSQYLTNHHLCFIFIFIFLSVFDQPSSFYFFNCLNDLLLVLLIISPNWKMSAELILFLKALQICLLLKPSSTKLFLFSYLKYYSCLDFLYLAYVMLNTMNFHFPNLIPNRYFVL